MMLVAATILGSVFAVKLIGRMLYGVLSTNGPFSMMDVISFTLARTYAISEAVTFAEIFVYLQVYFKLPTDAKLKIKLKPFAMEFATKYNQNATFNKD